MNTSENKVDIEVCFQKKKNGSLELKYSDGVCDINDVNAIEQNHN